MFRLCLAMALSTMGFWSTAIAQSDDEPDLDLEERFHSIYQKFNSEPTSEETWTQMTTSKQVEKYSVQGGDTLWDISQTLFGNGHFWPKLWQLNDRITNPHMIFPGKVLKFTPGSEAEPPSLNVAEGETGAAPEEGAAPEAPAEDANLETPEVPAVAEAGAPENEDEESGPVVPPPTSSSARPVLVNLPPSLPNLLGSVDSEDYGKTGLSIVYATPPPTPQKYLTSYLAEEEQASRGEVIEIETGGVAAFEGQYVFIKAEGGLSSKYVRFFETEKAQKNPVSGDKTGYIVNYKGEARLVDEVDPKEKVYRALITKAIGHVRLGDQVGPGRLEKFMMTTEGRHSSVKARLVGGEYAPDRKYLGQGALVYLDQGSSSGLERGQILPIYRRKTLEYSDLEEVPPLSPDGKLLVVKTTNSRSTALVLSCSDALRPGDYTGTGKP